MRARCASAASRSPAGLRTRSRGWAPASFSNIRARCTARPCSRTSSSRSFPTSSRGCSPTRKPMRAPAPSLRASASARCSTAARPPCRSPICARSRSPRRSRAIRKVLLIDEPFAGLTSTETTAFSDLICEFRDDGRAVLLVDHNVKSVSRLVDRVLAMYVGERIAEGSAEEVMRDETVRRVYLGGSMETAARPESSFRDTHHAVPRSRQCQRVLRQGAGAGETSRSTSMPANSSPSSD